MSETAGGEGKRIKKGAVKRTIANCFWKTLRVLFLLLLLKNPLGKTPRNYVAFSYRTGKLKVGTYGLF